MFGAQIESVAMFVPNIPDVWCSERERGDVWYKHPGSLALRMQAWWRCLYQTSRMFGAQNASVTAMFVPNIPDAWRSECERTGVWYKHRGCLALILRAWRCLYQTSRMFGVQNCEHGDVWYKHPGCLVHKAQDTTENQSASGIK